MRVLNFAHGEVVTLGAYLSFTAYHVLRLPYALVAVTALLGGIVIGLLLERLSRRPLLGGAMISVALLTIGVGFVVKGAARLIWPDDYLTFPPIYGMAPIPIGMVMISPQDAVIVGTSLALMMLFFALFRFSPLGKRMRASASNRLGALLVGIRVERMFLAAWVLSCMLGVIAGLLIAPISLIYADMGFDVFVKAFAGAVLGGFGSFPGAVLGGLLVGLIESLVGGYISTVLVGAAPFIIIAGVLLLFPRGLCGGVRES